MKSDPVRSAVRTSAPEGTSASAAGDIGGGTVRFDSAGCAAATAGPAASAAAPAAAPFRKFRRSTSDFDCLAMGLHLVFAAIFNLYHMNRGRYHSRFRGTAILGCPCSNGGNPDSQEWLSHSCYPGTLYLCGVDAPTRRRLFSIGRPCGVL